MITIRVPIILSAPPIYPVSLRYTTLDGSAKANQHYIPIGGTLSFPVGTSSRELEVQLVSPVDNSQDLSFVLSLSDIRGATPDYGFQITIRVKTSDSATSFILTPEETDGKWVVCTSSSPNLPIFGERGSCVPIGIPSTITLDTAVFELLEHIGG